MMRKKTIIDATALYAQNIRKSYGTRGNVQQVLKGIDLRVEEGEFIGIMGPSGSGKTTLLNVLATIDRATEGSILIGGSDISKMAAYRRNQLGFIFQDYNLLDTLTAKENNLLPVSLGKLRKKKAEQEFQSIASILGITELADKYPQELSGGQKQRTAAARALINEPRDVTNMMVTHDPLASSYCSRVVFLKDGRIYSELYKGTKPFSRKS